MAEEKVGWEQTKAIWANKDTRLIYKLIGAALLVAIGVWIGWMVYSTAQPSQAWGYGVNLFTSILSAAATVLVLDDLHRIRARQEAEDELKRKLVDDAASISNEIAKNAIHQLRRKEWLYGEYSLLQGKDINHTNLQGVDLRGANLQETNLWNANLQDAIIGFANLQRGDLSCAILDRADLRLSDFQDAELWGSKLHGTHLEDANLIGANLNVAEFDHLTILPDHTFWTPETDMKRFTDPTHPYFWRSENPYSPAYRGKREASG